MLRRTSGNRLEATARSAIPLWEDGSEVAISGTLPLWSLFFPFFFLTLALPPNKPMPRRGKVKYWPGHLRFINLIFFLLPPSSCHCGPNPKMPRQTIV